MKQDLTSIDKYHLNPSNSETSEGGLNLIEFKNIVQRKILLIAGCTLAMSSMGLIKILISPPRYVAGFELLSEPVNIETKVTSIDDETRKTREEIASVNLDEVQLKILKSPRLISRVVKSLQDRYPDLNYQEITTGLNIDIIAKDNEQNILQVAYENSNPQKVSDVVDTLTKTYIDYSVEKRQSGAKRGIAFLDLQIPMVSKQAETIKQQMSNLRNNYDFIDPQISIQQTYKRINELTQEKEKIDVQLQQLRLTSNNLQQELKVQPAKSSIAMELGTPRYLKLLAQLQEIEANIGSKSAVFTTNSLELQALEAEKQEILALLVISGEEIKQKLRNQINNLESRQNTINTELADLQLQLKQWSVIVADFSSLKQELNRANNKLNDFALRKDSLQIDAAQQDAPWLLLTPAGEPASNNFNSINYLILSSGLGLIVGIAIALILDKHQDIVYSASKVREITDLPILGTIPYERNLKQLSFVKSLPPFKQAEKLATSKSQIVKQNQLLSEFFVPSTEAFRSFAANLGLLNFVANSEDFNSEAAYKSLIVTSATSGEGKSIVALNLAKASASVGKKVLLVDTNIRYSTEGLSKSLGFETEVGLKNILNYPDFNLGLNHIRKLSIEENLYILTSGFSESEGNSSSVDSSRLFASAKMHLIMEQFKHHFDLIVYDLSSIVGFADVNLLAAKTDGIIIATGLGKVRANDLTDALNELKLCKAPILGIVANKLSNKN